MSDKYNPATQTQDPVAWRWRSTLFNEWNLSGKPPVDQATMERETELNMVGLEWEALYVGPSPQTNLELVDFVKSMRDGHAHRTDDYGSGYVDAMSDVLEAISSIASREGSSTTSPVSNLRGNQDADA